MPITAKVVILQHHPNCGYAASRWRNSARVIHTHEQSLGQGASLMLRNLGGSQCCWAARGPGMQWRHCQHPATGRLGWCCDGEQLWRLCLPSKEAFCYEGSQSKHPLTVFTRLNQSQSSTETCPTAFPQSHSWRVWTWLLAGVFNITGRRCRGWNNTESVTVTHSQLLQGVSST